MDIYGSEEKVFFSDIRTFWRKELFESYGVSALTKWEEVEAVRTFFGQGEGLFSILYKRLLSKSVTRGGPGGPAPNRSAVSGFEAEF